MKLLDHVFYIFSRSRDGYEPMETASEEITPSEREGQEELPVFDDRRYIRILLKLLVAPLAFAALLLLISFFL